MFNNSLAPRAEEVLVDFLKDLQEMGCGCKSSWPEWSGHDMHGRGAGSLRKGMQVHVTSHEMLVQFLV